MMESYNTYPGNNVVPTVTPVLQTIALEQERSNIRINEAAQKASIDVKKQLYLEDERFLRRETRRGIKEAEYKEIIVKADGEIQSITKNSLVPQTPREICNFKNPQLYYLLGSNGETGIYLLEVVLNNKERDIFFMADKMTARYVLNKMRCIGCTVYCRKERDAETFVENLLSYLLVSAKEKKIPGHIGWNGNVEDGFYFVKEDEQTWRDLVKSAR